MSTRGHEKSQLSTYVPVIVHAFLGNEEEDQNLPYHHWSMDLPHCNDNRCIRFDGRHGKLGGEVRDGGNLGHDIYRSILSRTVFV